MSNSGKVWDIREAYKLRRSNKWSLGSRGLFIGGSEPSESSVIDFINLNHTGNAVDFGDLITAGNGTQASNSIRAIKSRIPNTNIDYVTMATKGNSADFGDMIDSYGADSAVATNTRACFVGGYAAPTFSPGWNINRIQFVNIATLGNMADFGDLTQGRANQGSGADTTRGIFSGGYNGGFVNNTDFITVASTGNATDFGDVTQNGFAPLVANSPTKLFCAGGQPGATGIGIFTFSTLGNQVKWGDLPAKGAQGAGSASHTRGIFQMGEAASPIGVRSNRLESVSMTTSGNSTDFGDLTVGRQDTYGVAAQGHGALELGFFPRESVNYMPGSGRVFNLGGWASPSYFTSVDMIVASTLGNASDFGDLPVAHGRAGAGMSSLTRGLVGGGDPGSSPNLSNVIDSIEFASQGNGADFGDLTESKNYTTGTSSTTRGLRMGGGDAFGADATNVIDYVTMASAGNATDFGDQTVARNGGAASGSSTRGLCAGGRSFAPSSADTNIIDYVTISSTGNATDFGDLTVARSYFGGSSSSTRSVVGGGYGGSTLNVIDYVTIASTGNATDFGDLLGVEYNIDGGSNNTRVIWFGGSPNATDIQYVEIATTSDAIDFGDLSTGKTNCVVVSDSHGGLQA
tara:strand:- start:167 stop:2056 length:1890 start_codon:yes stop_codon:yes gene_type:complete